MKKIVKNAIFIVILIVIAMSIFNISYAMLNTGNFSKLATIKNTTIFTKDNNVKYSNLQSYKIENKDYNNSAYYQTIKVKKNTPYKISCMIKTNNVNVTNENKNDGAKISILNSEEESTAITGTNNITRGFKCFLQADILGISKTMNFLNKIQYNRLFKKTFIAIIIVYIYTSSLDFTKINKSIVVNILLTALIFVVILNFSIPK